jgi:hypothetical protein
VAGVDDAPDDAQHHEDGDGMTGCNVRPQRPVCVPPSAVTGLDIEKDEAKELIASNLERLNKLQERPLRRGRAAVRAAGVGRRGQGQRDRARHDGANPARLRGEIVQAARVRSSSVTTFCGAT